MVMGLDSAKEEMLAYQQNFLDRGLATLAFDGPGQGEGEYDFAIRGDYEAPVKAVIDWIETRKDLDAKRVGLWGVSLGGYYAPRACAFEKRVAACIALAGPYDWLGIWDKLPEITRAAFRVRSHAHDEVAAKQNAATLSLKGIAHRIECPIYIVSGSSTASCRPKRPSAWRARSRARASCSSSPTATTSPTTGPISTARKPPTGWRTSRLA